MSATPYNASLGNASAGWIANATALSQNSVSPNVYGVGYASLNTCANNATSATGSFAAVGAGGAIFTSADGQLWNNPASPPSGFSTDLFAVTGYAANQNNPGNPALRWVAVGAGGASIYGLKSISSPDGISWAVGNPYNSGSATLRSITHVAGTFFAVGDAGTILSSTDGIAWTPQTSGITANLNGVTHGTIYVYIAVGDNGTILTSTYGYSNTWTAHTTTATSNLRQVISFGSLIVAVGDAGTIVTSKDGGVTWDVQTLGATNLVGIAVEPLNIASPVVDAWLGVAPSAQFVIIDSAGNAYASVSGVNPNANGLTWSAPIPTTATSLNTLVSSGFGYVAAGNSGATAFNF
jgi:hypothetical protein